MIKKNKKGFYFIFDVLIGFTIILIGIIFMVSYYFRTPISTQPVYYSDDIVYFLTQTKFEDFSTNLTRTWLNSNLAKEENVFGEVFSSFCLNKDNHNFSLLINDTVQRIIPDHLSYQTNVLYLNNESICLTEQRKTRIRQEAPYVASSRSLILNLNQTFEIIGPYILEVIVW